MRSRNESTTVLIALGLLAEAPLHGHEIRQRFAERGISTFTPLTVGALYHALRVLEQRGLIAVRKTERVGARPERTVYEITAQGRKGLKESLVMGLASLQGQHFVVDAAKDALGNVQGFTLRGAGWGHGVGLCQIGAAFMATRGFRAEEILEHYFPAARLERAY